MALDSTPWFIGEPGALHSAEVARLAANAPAGNSDGIFAPADCKVLQLATPGAAVRIGPGAWKGLNRAPAGRNQAFIARVISDENVPIAGTGASARSDLICLTARDPSISGSGGIPGGPYHRVEVITVANTVTRLQDVAGYAGVSGYALARVDVPANSPSPAITTAMIKDLRQLAQTTSRTVPLMAASTGSMSGGASPNALLSSTFVTFPTAAAWTTEIPIWATHVGVIARVEGAASRSASVYGEARVAIGSVVTPVGAWDVQWDGKAERVDFGLGALVAIPSALRGTMQTVKIEGRRAGGTGHLTAGAGTNAVLQLIFEERIE